MFWRLDVRLCSLVHVTGTLYSVGEVSWQPRDKGKPGNTLSLQQNTQTQSGCRGLLWLSYTESA